MSWGIEKSVELYGIDRWGSGYFRVNEKGHVSITPGGPNGRRLDLLDLTTDLLDRGIRLPILVRFPDIVRSRIELVVNCFSNAIKEYGYKGSYRGVYPIKVNQQRHLVAEILKFGHFNELGLEIGSKPELLVALAQITSPNALIVCNGFKDAEYIETAILAQKLGKNTLIVVDRFIELSMIVEAAKKFNAKPRIGFRQKLNSRGAGKWVESSGARSKFGLTAAEIVEGIEYLKHAEMLDCLELLHFHIGSQITSIQAVKTSLREGARFFAEVRALGADLKYIDVGGGLGVDYDGSGSSDSSINYSEQEYANDVVSIIQEICDEREIPHPHIVSECGRAMVAHHSVLVFNVLGENLVRQEEVSAPVGDDDHQILNNLFDIYQNVSSKNINEYYHDLTTAKGDVLQLFNYGVLSLPELARAENLFWAAATKMASIAKISENSEDLVAELDQLLSDTYFCNFSVFQSMPDAWAVGQVFPVMPLQSLKDEPDRRATLVDLTCDSDGKIEKFIDPINGGTKRYLEVHRLKKNEPYFLGVFLLGAYQEILGDLHNLFGDTDAVHVTLSETGYTIDHVVEGDSVSEVLSYVQYHRNELLESVRKASEESISRNRLTPQEAKTLMKTYELGLTGYTYLEDPE